ncbi:hypothetical protein [Achromobacter sp. MFA1 R4]|nr:hypothetical protein [Achromobacter sp. MFA1 R4]
MNIRWYQHNTHGVLPITSPMNTADSVATKAVIQPMVSQMVATLE